MNLHLLTAFLICFSFSGLAQAESWIINEDTPAIKQEAAKNPNISGLEGQGRSLPPASSLNASSQTALDGSLTKAWRELNSNIRQHWSEVVVSDSHRWVSYSKNWKVRKVVDFESNSIQVTLPAELDGQRIDFQATSAEVTDYVVEILGMTLKQALIEDPLFSESFSNLGLSFSSDRAEELVLSELFNSNKPSKSVLLRKARQLMQSAEIGFYQQQASVGVLAQLERSKRLTYRVALPSDRIMKKAKQFRSTIISLSKQMDVPAELVFAIIHTESHFNPLARSPIPAYGLMQIVPRTAGRDATRLLFNQPQNLSPTYLYDPDNNIEVGVAYIKMLYTHYLKDIKDPVSRLYCTIAAYNTGSVNVARAFGSQASMIKAAPKINQLSPQQVLASLLSSLPSQETRDYLKKVLARKSLYARV